MVILTIIIATLFLLWATHGLIEHLRDRRFRSATRNSLHENWRKVPPPNWASRRGTQDYW
jgi:hypothetical protein